jgi:hypothetical protein
MDEETEAQRNLMHFKSQMASSWQNMMIFLPPTFNKYLLNTYFVPHSFLVVQDTLGNKTLENACPSRSLYSRILMETEN